MEAIIVRESDGDCEESITLILSLDFIMSNWGMDVGSRYRLSTQWGRPLTPHLVPYVSQSPLVPKLLDYLQERRAVNTNYEDIEALIQRLVGKLLATKGLRVLKYYHQIHDAAPNNMPKCPETKKKLALVACK